MAGMPPTAAPEEGVPVPFTQPAGTAASDARRTAPATARDADVLCVLGLDGVLRFGNTALRAALGLPAAGRDEECVVHPDDVALLAGLRSGAGPVPLDLRLRTAAGGWTELTLHCQLLGVGSAVRVLAASPALASVARRGGRRAAATAAPIGVYVIRDGEFRYVNPAFERFTGYPAAELIGRRAMDLVVPMDRRQLRRNAARVIAGDRWMLYEYRITTRDGAVRRLSENVARVRSPRVQATLGTCLDVTERDAETQALRDAGDRLRAIDDASVDLLALTGPAGRFLYVNDAHLGVLGYRSIDLLGTPAQALVHPDERLEALRALTAWAPGEQTTVRHRIRRRDGDWLWLESRVEVIHDGDGKYSGAVIISRDITARRRVETELHRIAEQLHAPADALAMLAFAATQGEGWPLQLLSSFAQLIARTCAAEAAGDPQSFIQGLGDETARFQALITDLLSIDGPDEAAAPAA